MLFSPLLNLCFGSIWSFRFYFLSLSESRKKNWEWASAPFQDLRGLNEPKKSSRAINVLSLFDEKILHPQNTSFQRFLLFVTFSILIFGLFLQFCTPIQNSTFYSLEFIKIQHFTPRLIKNSINNFFSKKLMLNYKEKQLKCKENHLLPKFKVVTPYNYV